VKSRCLGPVRRFTHLSRPFPRNLAYRRVWPVEGGPFQIKGLLATLEGERTIDLVTLTDRQKGLADYGPQYLAVYRLRSRAKGETPPPSGEALQLVTEAEIPRSQIAFYLSSDIGPVESAGLWSGIRIVADAKAKPETQSAVTNLRPSTFSGKAVYKRWERRHWARRISRVRGNR